MDRPNFAVRRKILLGALALLPLAACDATDSGEDARVQIQLTDAPADYIESAEIWISRVYLQGGPGDDDQDDGEDDTPQGRVDLFNDPENPFNVDLLVLRDGIVANLTEPVEVEAGSYKGLRIVVDSAFVTLKAGYTFASGATTQTLHIPSGSASGIKVQLAEPEIEAPEGGLTTLLVDFDVNQNFVIQGNPESPAGIQGILFTPVLRELARDVDEEDDGD